MLSTPESLDFYSKLLVNSVCPSFSSLCLIGRITEGLETCQVFTSGLYSIVLVYCINNDFVR